MPTNINIKELIIKKRMEQISFPKFCDENFITNDEDKDVCRKHFTNLGLDVNQTYPRYTWFILSLADIAKIW